MTDVGAAPSRPIILTSPVGRREFRVWTRGSESARLPSRERQAARLTPQFNALLRGLEEDRVMAQTSLPASDPELVLVFETRGSVADVLLAARNAGLELLMEVEEEFDPDIDFKRKTEAPSPVPGYLHVALTSLEAMRQLRQLWDMWSRGEPLPRGLGGMHSGLSSLFGHLANVRPWGPQDRVRATGLADAVSERIEGGVAELPIEVELWYYASLQRRQQAEASVRSDIVTAGGQILSSASHDGFGYHALAAVVSSESLLPLLRDGADAVELLRSSDVFVVRPGGQSVLPAADAEEGGPLPPGAPEPSGDPTVALLDGLPVANHSRLNARVTILDPDGLDDGTYEARLRRHGTEMASLIVWGDLGSHESPLERPLLSRPILKPDLHTLRSTEAVPDGVLLPDLMVRIFRELLGGDGDEGLVPTIRVLNLSVCDPHAPFDTIPSAWARALDWLSERYGVLVVVSAGNHPSLEIKVPRATFEEVGPDEQRRLALEAVSEQAMQRRLLNPAESINALTVGALNADSGGDYFRGHLLDPLGDAPLPSLVSALGSGFRRSVKPEMYREGGRQLYSVDLAGPPELTRLRPSEVAAPPGLLAASPTNADPTSGEVHLRGTSGAAALTTRRAAELLEVITAPGLAGGGIDDQHIAAALKALVVHGAEWPERHVVGNAMSNAAMERYLGYGRVARNHVLGCPAYGVTVLAVGDLGAHEEEDIVIPLPPGLSGLVGKRRVTATLAWVSPINWRHRQYRRAKLGFHSPDSPLKAVLKSTGVHLHRAQRGTVQHQIYEGVGAVPIGQADELRLTVQCVEQAGGLDQARVPYAVAVSLEVAEELGVDVYAEVTARIRPAVAIAARP